jgi:hypothetical protein
MGLLQELAGIVKAYMKAGVVGMGKDAAEILFRKQSLDESAPVRYEGVGL